MSARTTLAWLLVLEASCTFGFPLAPRRGAEDDAAVLDASADATPEDGGADSGIIPSTCAIDPACAPTRGAGPSCPPGAGWMCDRVLVSVAGSHMFGPNPRGGGAIRTTAIAPFWMDVYEVSVARFQRYVEAEGFRRGYSVSYGIPGNVTVGPLGTGVPGPCEDGQNTYTAPTADEPAPVNCVSWDLAMSFCAWDGGRLPTMAEIELVRRWWPQPGVPDPDADGRAYPWGETAPAPPGGRSLPRSEALLPFLCGFRSGCAWNIAGGVAEWQADVFSPARDACWSTASCVAGMGVQRVVMGGAWSDTDAENLPSASFYSQDPSSNGGPFGFRCAYNP